MAKSWLTSKAIDTYRLFIFYLVALLVAFIPLYPKFPFMNVPGTFVAIRAEDILIAFVIGCWGLYLILSKQLIKFLKDPLTQALLLFFFIGLVSVFSAVFITHTAKLHLAMLHYLRRVELILLMPVALYAIKGSRELKILFTISVIVAVLVNFYAIGQKYWHFPIISTTNSEFSKGLVLYLTPGGRVNATFAGHYDLAVYLVMWLGLATALFFALKRWLYKLVLAATGVVSME